MELEIKEIILSSEKGDKFHFVNKELIELISLSAIDFKKNILRNISKNKKIRIKIVKILIFAFFRKIFNKKPAINENNFLRSINKSINVKKIHYLELIFNNNQKITFFLGDDVHLLNLMGDIIGIITNNQYNISEENIKSKIVFDCGAHNGVFSIYCSLFKPKKIYSFEPVLSTLEILSKNMKLNNLNKEMIIVNKAVGENVAKEKIFFDKIADGSASLNKEKTKYEIVDVTSLDNFVKLNKIKNIGLIKMDIEGNEEKALIGARNLIKKYKPVLTFSAYHKKEDKVLLPKLVKSIREDYTIDLLNKFEEDFYCF
jgi:FkbM family methyltransferase